MTPMMPATVRHLPAPPQGTPVQAPLAVLRATEALGQKHHDGSPSAMPRIFRVPNGAIMLRQTHRRSYDEAQLLRHDKTHH